VDSTTLETLESDYQILERAAETTLQNAHAEPSIISAFRHFLAKILVRYETMGGQKRIRQAIVGLFERLIQREYAYQPSRALYMHRPKLDRLSSADPSGLQTTEPLLVAQLERLRTMGKSPLTPHLQERLDEEKRQHTQERKNRTRPLQTNSAKSGETQTNEGLRTTDAVLLRSLEKLRTMK
jgi:hypothetical protein